MVEGQAQAKQCKYYNQKTKTRMFQARQNVLVLLPTDSARVLEQGGGHMASAWSASL